MGLNGYPTALRPLSDPVPGPAQAATLLPPYGRPCVSLTTAILIALVLAFLGMRGGELVAAMVSPVRAFLGRALDHLSAASTSVLAVLAALLAPSPIQR